MLPLRREMDHRRFPAGIHMASISIVLGMLTAVAAVSFCVAGAIKGYRQGCLAGEEDGRRELREMVKEDS